MKRREDELFELAFGDLSSAEAQRLSAHLAADEIELVEELRGMKLDLSRFDVPEHQLSTERLRDAILREGLQPNRPSHSWLRYAFAPLAAACFAVMLYPLAFPQTGTSSTRESVAIRSETVADSGAIDSNPMESIQFRPDHWFEGTNDRATGLSSEVRSLNEPTTPRSERRPFSSRGAKPIAAKPTDARSMGVTANPAPAKTTAVESMGASAPSSMALADSHSNAGQPGVVLIGTDVDTATGANRATEVHDSRNVLIGG